MSKADILLAKVQVGSIAVEVRENLEELIRTYNIILEDGQDFVLNDGEMVNLETILNMIDKL